MRKCLEIGVFLCLLLWGWSVHAYILPAKQILAYVSDHIAWQETLVVLQKTVLYDPDLEGGMQEFEETLYYRHPRQVRTEVSTEGFEKVQVVSPEGVLTIIGGKIIGEAERPFDHFKDVFMYEKAEYLADGLTRLGVDLSTVTFGRYKGKVAFVMGMSGPDQQGAQIWVEKDSFHPIRLVLKKENGEPLREIEYSEYRPVRKGKTYPMRIFFYENGELVRMHVLESFDINADISEELFDLAYLKNQYETVTPQPAPTSPLDEVRKTIQDFRKIFD